MRPSLSFLEYYKCDIYEAQKVMRFVFKMLLEHSAYASEICVFLSVVYPGEGVRWACLSLLFDIWKSPGRVLGSVCTYNVISLGKCELN